VSDDNHTAAHSVDTQQDARPEQPPVRAQAETERSKLRNHRIDAVKAEVEDAAAVRSQMIEAMRRRLEAQVRLPDEPAEEEAAKEQTPRAEPVMAPPQPAFRRMAMPNPSKAALLEDEAIFVPEAEARALSARHAPKAPVLPDVWDEALHSAQRVENALARLQEALDQDERRSRRLRKPAPLPQAARPRRLRPLRVATLFTASFLIGLSAFIFAYDWQSSTKIEARLAEVARQIMPSHIMKLASNELPARASTEKPLAAVIRSQSKKIAAVRLETFDAEGVAGTDIPLKLRAEATLRDQKVDLRLVGIPEDISLSVGQRLKDGSWLVKPADQTRVSLQVPAEVSGHLQLSIEALEQETGELATPPQEIGITIAPAKRDAEPEASAVEPTPNIRHAAVGVTESKEVPLAEPPPPEVELAAVEEAAEAPAMAIGIDDPSRPLMARGDALMEIGDVAAARRFYDRAYDLGNIRAARSIARTYDPVVLGSMNVQGMRGDAAMALEWYRKAEKAGEPDATQAIAALETYLGQ
jgi:hypothetical protein